MSDFPITESSTKSDHFVFAPAARTLLPVLQETVLPRRAFAFPTPFPTKPFSDFCAPSLLPEKACLRKKSCCSFSIKHKEIKNFCQGFLLDREKLVPIDAPCSLFSGVKNRDGENAGTFQSRTAANVSFWAPARSMISTARFPSPGFALTARLASSKK